MSAEPPRTSAYRYVHVDVFTQMRFGGNQLAVLPEADGLTDAQMQTIAREFNFSETAFVLPPADPAADARVRIFTPGRELPFAGHPVVGTAFVLARERGKHDLRLEVQVGTLEVRADPGDGETGEAEMEQPLPSFTPAPDADAVALAALVGVEVADVASETPAEIGSAGTPLLYLRLRSLDAVRRSAGDAAAMARYFAGTGLRNNVYVFSMETEDPAATAHVRMFSLDLGSGVREDPATGGAAGPAAAYLLRHGLAAPGTLLLEQGIEMGRPSRLRVTIDEEGGQPSRVRVAGGVVLVAEGTLRVSA